MMNNNIGAAYEYRKEPEQSISYYKTALASFTLLKDTLWMANVLNNIAIQLNVAERNKESLEHYLRAKALYTTLHDSSTMATLIPNMAECYRLLGQYTTAIDMENDYLNNYKNFTRRTLSAMPMQHWEDPTSHLINWQKQKI
ncbi:MAG: tetratricopeptide repeat protein [Saprospiraceae bacterium]|uniref:Tetratricopeptide repeat protein n=1 Tax=Candidatus Opimibacter skivensis TaxID=2982028 RepID=A0A9D7XNC7_9BACT|nr:tetratricopeptide repeat protein [Candidatus Opimibacter skivensis]